jgi:hypothetical protein
MTIRNPEGVASKRFAYRTGGDHLDIIIFAVAVPVIMPRINRLYPVFVKHVRVGFPALR